LKVDFELKAPNTFLLKTPNLNMPLSPTGKRKQTIPGPLVQTVASLSRLPPTAKPSSFYDIPQTPLCLRAEKLIKKEIPDWAANHCFRTYAFGLAIANYAEFDTEQAKIELGFDKELHFITCALHEWGMSEEGINQSKLSLELWGALRAREWILEQKSSTSEIPTKSLGEWADLAAEAIARHTIEFRGFSKSVNIQTALLTLGSGQDLMGLSSAFVHADDIKLICEKWPRIGYVDGLRALTKEEVTRKPGCLFEGCRGDFDPGMYHVSCYTGIQGSLTTNPASRLSQI
jgi:cyanamide hydratase family protein with HD domain